MRAVDISGQRFQRLTVIERSGISPNGGANWLCSCNCGMTKVANYSDLKSGKVSSCGCRNREGHATHGQSKTRLYEKWKSMRSRCEYSGYNGFHNYGGRGIAVCDEWRDFEKFQLWASRTGYLDGLTIERIDNDAGYSPENCVWVPKSDQARNRRVVHKDANGNLWSEIAVSRGISRGTFLSRIHYGWPPEEAATRPLRGK